MAALQARKPLRFDVLDVSDLTFLGGTARSVAEEVQAQHRAGYRSGVLHLQSPILKAGRPFHRTVLNCVQAGLAELVELGAPVETRAVVVRSPRTFARVPDARLPIETERVVVVANHSHRDLTGDRPGYSVDPLEVDAHLRRTFDAPVVWAPLGPAIRRELASLAPSLEVLPDDWYNVIDVDAWAKDRSRFVSDRPVIGRHGRNDLRKWPDRSDVILAAYPDDPRFEVRILGGESLPEGIVDPIPDNWTLHAYDAIHPRRFLHGIDFFVYFHHPLWVEAFGRTILEALASGCPVLLPHHFEGLYRDACLYVEPGEVAERVLGLYADGEAYRAQARRAEARARERFGYGEHVRRLAQLIGAPDGRTPAARRPRPVLLLVAGPGTGEGEAQWLLELAERARPDWTPVFAGEAPALARIAAAGHAVERLPAHPAWPAAASARLAGERLAELWERHEPVALVLAGGAGAQRAWPDAFAVLPRLRLRARGEGDSAADAVDPGAVAPEDALARIQAAVEEARGARR